MTFFCLTRSAVLFSALALPAMAQGAAHSQPVAPAKTSHAVIHPIAATSPVPSTATPPSKADVTPGSIAAPVAAPVVTPATPATTLASPAPAKPATVKPN